jgi:divalent metal cation (Fe/Co/Zn/Cd) transporter
MVHHKEVPESPIPLIERSDKEIARAIMNRVKTISEVRECSLPSVRLSGKRIRVELSISLDSNIEFYRTHQVALKIERAVKTILPNARVIIRTEPYQSNLEKTWGLIRKITEDVPGTRGISDLHVQNVDGKLSADLAVEVSANMTMKQAHKIAMDVEKRLRGIDPSLSEVNVHTETALERISREATGADTELKWYIAHVARRFPGIKSVQGIRIRKVGNDLQVLLRCQFEASLNVKKATEFSSKLEKAIRDAYPDVARIIIKKEAI